MNWKNSTSYGSEAAGLVHYLKRGYRYAQFFYRGTALHLFT